MRVLAVVAALTLAVAAPVAGAPSLASSGCPLFPADNAAMGPGAGIHADFGSRHVLVVQAGSCRLYELFDAHREGGGWRAGSGAVWNLRANRLRPAGWTDERWDNDALRQLRRVTLADFEAVDTARLRIFPASAAARGIAGTARTAPADAATPRTEPSLPPASVQATPPESSAGAPDPAAAPTGDPPSEALLPQLLAAILGVVAAALAFREVARRTRRPTRRP
jgi:hypothetical protein